MKRLLFIAVIYNNVAETRDLCLSLSLQTPGDYSAWLVLVDNSDDPTARAAINALVQEFPFSSVLRPGNNLGYFPAITFALEKYAKEYDLVIAGNNDLKYDKDFSKILSDSIYSDEIMVICPDVVTAEGVHQNPHHKYRLSWAEKLYFDIYFASYFSARIIRFIGNNLKRLLPPQHHANPVSRSMQPAQEIDQGVGAVYVFRPQFLRRIGYRLYYPGFLYGEEACLSWQVRDAGGKTWYDPSLKVWHAESATLGQLPSNKTYRFARQSYWKFRTKL